MRCCDVIETRRRAVFASLDAPNSQTLKGPCRARQTQNLDELYNFKRKEEEKNKLKK